MGVEYALVKPQSGAAYELGKPTHRPPPEDWEDQIKDLSSVPDALGWWQAVMNLSEQAMWSIGSDGKNCELTVLTQRWTVGRLAAVVDVALFTPSQIDKATAIAQDILDWAGDDPVVLVPDTMGLEDIASRINMPIAPIRIQRSVYDLAGAPAKFRGTHQKGQHMISYGTILKAKPHHPIYKRGGTGVAFVTDNGEGTDFFTYMWVGGDPATPGFSGDVGAIAHLDKWFDVIPENEHAQHLPEGFAPPPNPRENPEEAFMAMFNIGQ